MLIKTSDEPGKEALFEKALEGRRQIVFITGEPGIGKTTLTEVFLQRAAARPGVRIARGQCIERYREQEAYYPVLEAMSRLCREAGWQELVEFLAQYAPTWLVQFPFLVTPAHRERLQREILGATKERMLRELCEVLEAITSEKPLLLAFEDLHWADYSTLDLISALARRREPARLLLLATYRPVEVILAEHPLKPVKRELRIQRHCEELPLELLSEAAVAEYLAAQFPANSFPTELAGLIHEQTDGNPLFMVTAVEYLTAQGVFSETGETATWSLNATLQQVRSAVPNSVQQIIERLTERLTAEERELLNAASVAGVEFTAWAAAAGAGRDPAGVEACLDTLVQRQLMLRDAGLAEAPDGSVSARYQFTHSLYREALHRKCSLAAKVRLHQRIGEELERRWATDPSDIASELARHFQEGRDHVRTVRYLRLAAEKAMHRYSHRDAVTFLQSARESAGKIPEETRAYAELQVLEELATVHSSIGERERAAELYQTLASRAVELDQREVEARALTKAAHQTRWFDMLKALESYERAALIASQSGIAALEAESRANACFIRIMIFGWQQEWAETAKRCVDWMRDAGQLECFARSARISANIRRLGGDYQGAAQVATEGASQAARAGASEAYIFCCFQRGWALTGLGRFGESANSFREAIEMAERCGDVVLGALIKALRADLYCEAFDFAGARSSCQEALTVFRAAQFLPGLRFALVPAATAETAMGGDSQALANLAELEALSDRADLPMSWYWKVPMSAVQCDLSLARRGFKTARAEAERLLELSDRTGERAWQSRARQMSARVALRKATGTRAEADIKAALAMIEGFEVPLAAWRVYETAAEFYALTGDGKEAERNRELRKGTLLGMANSLAQGEPLRESILLRVPQPVGSSVSD